MVYLKKRDADKVVKELSNTSSKEIKSIIEKMKSSKKRVYVNDRSEIRKLLRKAFEEKRKVKMKYYSPHSDEHTTRIIDIYQIYINSLIAFCHLRGEERTFAIERINSATLLDEKYNLPENWSPESIILDK